MGVLFIPAMVLQRLTLVLLGCSLISAGYVDYGISSYCKKSQKHYLRYPPTPIECCAEDLSCKTFIPPGGKRFGLENTDTQWSKRECYCDVQLRQCLRDGITKPSDRDTATRFMNNEQCFYMKYLSCSDRDHCSPIYEFTTVLRYLRDED